MNFKPKIEEKLWNSRKESEIFRQWERKDIYRYRARQGRRFVIDTPPPYPSGRPWHIGAAAHYSQIDMIARTARMLGHDVLFPIGIDRNGLPVEIYTEKTYGISIHTTPREKFIELCRHALDDLEAEMISIMKTMGLSGDFKNHYRTDLTEYRRLTQATFIQLWKKGLIYEATRPNNYCSDCGTTIADAEIEYQELPAKLVYMRFEAKETGEKITVASTRPELLCSCQLVIVNPTDERYRKFQGMHAVIPLYNREVMIESHHSVKPEYGSGAVMVCSYGDYTDVLHFRELRLKEIVAINENGRMTENAGALAGLTVNEAREKITQDLQNNGFLEKTESINHRTPICERSQTPIEIIPMKEYYLKQIEFVPTLRRLARKIIFHPDSHRQILLNWIDSLTQDWPITRRRYNATEVPVWYCKKCGSPHVPKPGPYYQPWKDRAPFKRCRKCGNTDFVGDKRTFDTWMDSSVSPLFITGYSKDTQFYRKNYPVGIRPQGKDIVRTWLHYTILRCYQLTGKAPFKHTWIMGMGLDEHGRPMHRHLGNVLDPTPILEKYGADAFRLWAASEANIGYDFRVSEVRIAGTSKFLTKLWNISRFISAFPYPKDGLRLEASDKWILGELSKLVRESMNGYRDFNFYVPANLLREFLWNVFASHYVEMAKPRAYGQGRSKEAQRAAWFTLHTCLSTSLLLLAPIAPFITEALWMRLYGKRSIHLEKFPRPVRKSLPATRTSKLLEFNAEIWRIKKERGLSLKDAVDIEVPKELRSFEEDLMRMHNIRAD